MKSILIILIAGFSMLINICTGQDIAAMNYIKDNAITIDTSLNADLKDLTALKPVFAGRRIIGMGEATHGTHEFQIEKFRMLKFLVTGMNYKLLGIEANFTECRQVNDYVMYGKGESKKAVSGMIFWTWNTAEVLQMVEWMRNYNVNRPDEQKVKFYGFDMQMDSLAIQKVSGKLKKLDSAYFNLHFLALKNIHLFNKSGYTSYSKEKMDSIKVLFIQVKKYTIEHQNELLKFYPAEEVEYNKRDIRLLEQCLDEGAASTTKKVFINEGTLRDKYMAENIEWILDHEGKDNKMLVWAHNGHVSKAGKYFDSMGQRLEKMYNGQYYVIGFDFNKGSFRAWDFKTKQMKVFTVTDAEKGSSGLLFSGLNRPAFFIDIEKAVQTKSAAKQFFSEKIRQRAAGASFSMDSEKFYYEDGPFYSEYDGLIFVNETSATVQLNKPL
jgi:erythromycin esterase